MQMLEIGAADLQVTLRNGSRVAVPVQSFGLGIFRVWVPNSTYEDHPGTHPGIDPETGQPTDVASGTLNDGGRWQTFSFAPVANSQRRRHHPEPQDPVTAPIGDLRGNLEKILKQRGCEEYTNKLLAQAAKMFAGNYPHMKTIMDGYDLINSSKGGGYILKQTPFDTVDGDLFANGARPGTVWLVPNRQYGSMSARRIAEFQADYAWTALHETFHLGKQGKYDDEQLAAAAYSLAGKELPTTSQTGYGRATFFSDKFDKELMKHCPKP